MARVRLTYVTPNGQIFPIDIAQEDGQATISELLDMVLVVDEMAKTKGLSIMGKKLVTTDAGAKAAAVPKLEGVREGNILYQVVSIDILPKPDGSVEVAFFGDEFSPGERNLYATLFVNTNEKFPVESIQKLLEPYHTFKTETFKVAGTYNVDFLAEYFLTEKLNSAGKPYKNVAGIHVKPDAKKPTRGQAPPPPPQQTTEPPDIPF